MKIFIRYTIPQLVFFLLPNYKDKQVISSGFCVWNASSLWRTERRFVWSAFYHTETHTNFSVINRLLLLQLSKRPWK